MSMDSTPWERKLTRGFQYKVALQLFPYALRHLTVKPFRSTAQAQLIKPRLDNLEYQRAAHDMYCEMFLEGYEESTSLPVSRATGFALVLFTVFIFLFDREFERSRRAGKSPDYLTIIDTPQVAEAWAALAQYLHMFGCDQEILDYLLCAFSTYYDDYRQHVDDAMSGAGFEITVKLVEHDSGRALLTIYEIIRLFNGHEANTQCANEFFALGMAGKFFDDLRDMADDVAAGVPNLLHSLASESEEERLALEAALQDQAEINLWWWSDHCPTSIDLYFRQAFDYYDQVHSPKLRLTLDVLLALLRSRLYWRKPIRQARAR
jgi:hypothetical protein